MQVRFCPPKEKALPWLQHAPPDRVRHLSDADLTALKSFWMWEPFKEKRESIRDWDEHKREAMQKFAEYVKGRGRGIEADDSLDPLRIGSPVNSLPQIERTVPHAGRCSLYIHGNLPALEAVVEEIRRERVAEVVVGGDIVPGPMSHETMAPSWVLMSLSGLSTATVKWRSSKRWLARPHQGFWRRIVRGFAGPHNNCGLTIRRYWQAGRRLREWRFRVWAG